MIDIENEIWAPIKNLEGKYSVSNYGSVKSLSRLIHSGPVRYMSKEKILSCMLNKRGYLQIGMSLNGKKITRDVHQLVAESFLGHVACGMELVIDHKNFNKADNRLSNLRILTHRENTNKKHIKSSSQYVGVSFCKQTNKWLSKISINKKIKNLGRFNTEIEAHNMYQDALLKHTNEKSIK